MKKIFSVFLLITLIFSLYSLEYKSYLAIMQAQSEPAKEVVLLSRWSGQVQAVQVQGKYAYVGLDKELLIMDISNPTSPLTVSQTPIPANPIIEDIQVVGNIAYIATGWNGLRLMDISQPANPRELSFVAINDYAYRVVISGTRAYLADGDKGLRIFDIATAQSPQQLGEYDTHGTAKDLVLVGNQAYIADGDRGVQVIDVTDPTHPTLKQSYSSPMAARRIAISNSTLYMANELDNGLIIAPLTNITQSTFYAMSAKPQDMSLVGNLLYVATEGGGLWVFDVTTPMTPTELGYYNTNGQTCRYDTTESSLCHLVVTRSDVYLTGGNNGLLVLRYEGIGSSPVLKVAPTKLPFEATQGGDNPISQSLTISNDSHGDPLNWTVQEDVPWLSVDNSSGINSGAVKVMVDISGLITGVYTGQIMVSGSDASDSPQSVEVELRVFPRSIVGDIYEEDNSCDQARSIATDGTTQEHTFHAQADQDWVMFQATKGITYTIEGRVPPTSKANLILEAWSNCSQAIDNNYPSFSGDSRLQLVAPNNGKIYLHLLDENPSNYGSKVNYYLSVRAWKTLPLHGAVIIVAGRYEKEKDDPLQSNIEAVTQQFYRLFLSKGHPKERIRYLSTNLDQDVDGDFKSDVDGLPSQQILQDAITNWAKNKVGPQQALTLFIMDHGGYDKFFLDRPRNEILKPADLDRWLTELETATSAKVNVIIEACQAGSFIDQLEDPLQTIRHAGRIVVAATGAYPPSYATAHGAVFSDAFLSALAQDQDLKAAFDEGKWAVESLPEDKFLMGYQTPWLNGDDNSIPNQASDYQIATQRGFGITGSFPSNKKKNWAPYITQAEIHLNGQIGQVWAKVLDDQPENNTVWAVIYSPSYQPPISTTKIVPEPPRLPLLRGTQVVDGWEYSSNWLFNESGTYQLVIYAKDDDGLLSRPYVVTITPTTQSVYLPLIVK